MQTGAKSSENEKMRCDAERVCVPPTAVSDLVRSASLRSRRTVFLLPRPSLFYFFFLLLLLLPKCEHIHAQKSKISFSLSLSRACAQSANADVLIPPISFATTNGSATTKR